MHKQNLDSHDLSHFDTYHRYSPNQLAQELDVHISTIWRWMKKGVGRGATRVVLRAFRIGGRVYILKDDVEQFLRAINEPDLVQPETKPSSYISPDDDAERLCEEAGL